MKNKKKTSTDPKSAASSQDVRATTRLKVRTGVKAGGLNTYNHNRPVRRVKVRTGVKAGGLGSYNHNRGVRR